MLAALSVGVVAATAWYVYRVVSKTSVASFTEQAATIGAPRIAIALVAYLASHLLRALRLALLLDEETLSLRGLLRIQLFANGANLALPFKLGELYRIAAFNGAVRDGLRATIVIVTERILDFCVIFLTLITLLAVWRPELPHAAYVATLGTAFLLTVLVVFFVIPENIETLQIFVIRRYNAPWTVVLLTQLQHAKEYVLQSRRLLSKKLATVALATASVWALEIGAVVVLFSPFASGPTLVLLALYVFISGLLPPTGKLSGLLLAFAAVSQTAGDHRLAGLAAVYQACIFLPGAVLALLVCWQPIREFVGRSWRRPYAQDHRDRSRWDDHRGRPVLEL